MGIGGIGIWQLLIILAIIVMLFGTKKLRNMGADLGNAIKGFKKAMHTEGEADKTENEQIPDQSTIEQKSGETIDVKAESIDQNK